MYFLTKKRVIDTGDGQLIFEEPSDLSQSIRYCKMLDEDERHLEEIGSQAFMQALKKKKDTHNNCKDFVKSNKQVLRATSSMLHGRLVLVPASCQQRFLPR